MMSKEEFLSQAFVMNQLEHENILELCGVCALEEPIYIVTEYMCRGDLLSFLRKGEGVKLEVRELVHIAAQVATPS